LNKVTHEDFSNWGSYLFGAVTFALILALGRLGFRRVDSVVQRCIPARFAFARTVLTAVLMAILFGVMLIIFFTVFGVIAAYFSPCSFHC
jgi:hypothetical protein